jgi:argininosuccinate lyase
MNKKLWAGRFTKKPNPVAESFTESLSYDRRLAPYDIEGSIAHVKMLKLTKIIKKVTADKIIKALKEIKNITPPLRGEEDIHMFIENLMTKKLGDTAKYMHTGRSRNDQVQTDTRLYVRAEIKNILNLLTSLQRSIVSLADKNKDVIMPGVTHLQHAQPVLFSHHILAYVNMFERDKERLNDLQKRVNILPLGSGAIAGSTLPLDRLYTAKLLGFKKVSENSMDSVSDRDYIVELLSSIAITGAHLSRIAEELVLWSTKEYNFIDIDESLCTGSSLMPQKKNPDPAEILRAKTGRLNGNLMNILVILKGLPLSYNRDLQEDKPPLFDSIDTIKISLEMAKELINGIAINKTRIENILEEDDSYLATDLADYLVKKGVPFRQAHHDVGALSRQCLDNCLKFNSINIEVFKKFNNKFEHDVKTILSKEASVNNKKTIGSTNPKMVYGDIKKWKRILK